MKYGKRQLAWLGVMMWSLAAGGIGCDDDGGGGGGGAADGGVMTDMAVGGAGGEADAEIMPDAMAPAGEISVSAERLDFGEVGVGMTAQLELVVTHAAGGPARITGFDGLAAPFSIGREPPIQIPEGAERTLVVAYRPMVDQLDEASFQIVTDNPAQGALEVSLRGVGVKPSAELLTPALDFGVLSPGQSGSVTLQVRNISETALLSINGLVGIEAPFSGADNFQPRQVEAGLTEDIPLLFSSDEGGLFEATATLQTSAGDLEFTLQARVIDPGSLEIGDVEPAWGPVDEAVTITVHGGPFEVLPDAVRVGERALSDLELLDPERIRGTLEPGGEAAGDATDVLDVRVEIGEQFGVLPAAFVQTAPVADGSILDAEALAQPIGPAGNPWRLAIDEIPAEQTLTLEPGAVVLGEGRTLSVAGLVSAGGAEGRIVFSAASRAPGGWGGLIFESPGDGSFSLLENVALEYTGEEAAVLIRRPEVNLTDVAIRQGAGGGVKVEDGGSLLFLGGRVTDMAGDAIDVIDPQGAVGRLGAVYVRRCEWPVASYVGHFGGQPQGAGSDWAQNRAGDAIGLGGAVVTEGRLSNQPEGIRYQVRAPILVTRGAALSLASAAPLTLDGLIEVSGELTLPMGLTIQAAEGGLIDVLGGGVLNVQGGNGAEVAIRGRAEGAEMRASAWHGIRVASGGTANVRFMILQDAGASLEGEDLGAALRLQGDFEDVVALQVRDSVGAAIRLDGSGAVRAFQMSGNAAGIVIGAGAGLLAGETADPEPAIRFEDPALCDGWDREGVLTPMGIPASTNCP